MLPKTFILSLEEKYSQIQCPDCHQYHRVTIIAPKGVVYTPCFDAPNCEGFKVLVTNLLKTDISRRMNDPLPMLK